MTIQELIEMNEKAINVLGWIKKIDISIKMDEDALNSVFGKNKTLRKFISEKLETHKEIRKRIIESYEKDYPKYEKITSNTRP